MSKGRTLSQLISAGAVLADGQISASEIVGMVSVLKVTGTTYPGNDLAANPSGGQIITLTGSNFISTPTVYVGDTIAPSVTFVSSTQLTFTAPAKTAGTYSVYVVNPDGTTAILVNGISYSGTPAWTTPAGSLGSVDGTFTLQLQAAGDAPITYTLTTGSTLPSGVTLSSSGLITGTAIGSDQTFSFSVDAIDAQNQETPRSFQVTVVLADQFFRYTTLLLQADPLITPFNSDASTNAFNLTLNGDVRSDSFTPYQGAGYYSVAFDGNGDYLTTPTTTDFDLTGDFTIECWVNVAASGQNCLFSVGVPRGAYSYTVYINPDNTVTWALNNVATWNVSHSYSTTDTVPLNTWTHLAFVRSGSNFTIYINGVSKATTASYTQPSTASGTVYIGTYFANTNNDASFFRGCVSNFRVVKGTAIYTAAFTPPTSPLTAVTNTKFLIAQNNRFVDNSTNNYAITLVGDTKISPAQPFTNPTNISTYGSGYFDGTTDYLDVAQNAALGLSTGDFTIEAWHYSTNLTTNNIILDTRLSSGTGAGIVLGAFSTGAVFVAITGLTDKVSNTGIVKQNSWNHYVATRSGTTVRIFINGVMQGYFTGISNDLGSSNPLRIGYQQDNANNCWGYISDVRIIKGYIPTAYQTTSTTTGTAVFTSPTTLLTADTGTSILTLRYNGGSNNSGFEDSSQFNWPVTRIGNTTQGTFTPYGTGWSNYFDGSGDYLTIGASGGTAIGTGDFTLEFWVYMTSSGTTQIDMRPSNTNGAYISMGWVAGPPGTALLDFYVNSTSRITSSTGPTLNAWSHMAVSRVSGNTRVFIDGVQVGSTWADSTNYLAANTNIWWNAFLGARPGTGYISNYRLVLSGLYSANFTPPTTALTAISGTQILACHANRFIDSSTNNYSITRTGDVGVQRFDPFPPTAAYSTSVIGGSGYFDGSGDYLTLPVNPTFELGTNACCVEAWVYLTNTNNFGLFTTSNNVSGQTRPNFYVAHNGIQLDYFGNVVVQANVTVGLNTWRHIAFTRASASGPWRIFLDGVLQAYNATGSQNLLQTGAAQEVGRLYAGTTGQGYLSNLRVTNGSVPAAYVTSSTTTGAQIFSPPTTPLTSISGTVLLLNFINPGIYDGTGISTIETIGGTQVTSNIKKYGSGSIAMLTTSDYCRATLPSTFGDINGGDFTIEFWVNFTSVSANRGLISKYGNTAENAGALGYVVQFQQSVPCLRFVLGNGSTDLVYDFAWSPAVSTWYHVAITRSGTSARAFVNGTQIGSTTTVTTADVASPNPVQIGKTHTVAQYLLGYMDDIRVTRGVARYTANFTAPTSAMKAR